MNRPTARRTGLNSAQLRTIDATGTNPGIAVAAATLTASFN